MMRHPAGEIVSVLPYVEGARDSHGKPIPGWGDPIPYEGCAVAPAWAGPYEERRDMIVGDFSVFGPPEMVVGSKDRVICRGETWDVVENAALWHNPFTGDNPGIQFTIKRVEG